MSPRCLVWLIASACVVAQAGEVRTRAAHFRAAPFDQLPGWRSDNSLEARDTLLRSCAVLARKEHWRALCDEARAIPAGDIDAARAYFERHFTALAVHKTDESAVGDITGYYEPLVAGRRSRDAAFTIPVHGTPRDMVTLDLRLVPRARRDATLWLRREGRSLLPVAARSAASIRIDLERHTLDVLDRRLRLRIENGVALPYHTRAQIGARQHLEAPVLAWLDDPMALYAMQVQGSGRIRMPDGATLRLSFAEQNGHPFRPLRIASAARGDGVRARGIASGDDEPERFELAERVDAPLTRGIVPARRATASEVDAVVEQLLGRKPRPAPGAAAPPPAVAAPGRDTVPRRDASGTNDERSVRLAADPSYVFFQIAADQSPRAGPIGALGVPLTAGRSLAVDPRVTPLGYPVWLSAHASDGTGIERLAFAQDTGGAIRGAVRADYFRGFGAAAGREALRTRHAGRMWVLLPHEEARAALAARPLTRAVGGSAEPRECLLDDDEFCAH